MVQAVKGGRTALNLFILAGIDLAANIVISRMFSRFDKNCFPREINPPEWNLALVLGNLTHPPFELLELSSTKHLT